MPLDELRKKAFKPGSKLAEAYEELMKNPLFAPSKEENHYHPSEPRSCLAGSMPEGDYSGSQFLESDLYKQIQDAYYEVMKGKEE